MTLFSKQFKSKKLNHHLTKQLLNLNIPNIINKIFIKGNTYPLILQSMIQAFANKQLSTVNFSHKVKSPYTMQYLQFEERLNGKKIKVNKLPTLLQLKKNTPLNTMPTEDYLELAHQLINNKGELNKNKGKIWFGQDKQNLYPTIESTEETMNCIKNRIIKIKNKHSYDINAQIMQQSEQLTNHHKHLIGTQKSENSSNNRSRVNSDYPNLKTSKEMPITFLLYKKSKRQLSTRFKL